MVPSCPVFPEPSVSWPSPYASSQLWFLFGLLQSWGWRHCVPSVLPEGSLQAYQYLHHWIPAPACASWLLNLCLWAPGQNTRGHTVRLWSKTGWCWGCKLGGSLNGPSCKFSSTHGNYLNRKGLHVEYLCGGMLGSQTPQQSENEG